MTRNILTALAVFYLGYAIAVLRHDCDQWAWQVPWLVGQNRRAHSRIRRLEAVLNLPQEPDPPDPGTPPGMFANLVVDLRDARTAIARWSQRFRFWLRTPPGTRYKPAADKAPAPAADAPPTVVAEEPVTEPIPQVRPKPRPDTPPPAAPGPDTVPTATVIADDWEARSAALYAEAMAALDRIASGEPS